MATLMRMVQTGEAAVDAWRSHYPQLELLFEGVAGFEPFMVDIANSLLKDNKFGMMFRVGTGAILSTLDAATDIYTITTYYKNGLGERALALLLMISLNMAAQLILCHAQCEKKSWGQELQELLYCLLFLKPGVDAYRVSTNSGNDDGTVDSLAEMVSFKVAEMAFEAIPGCVLQIYVLLTKPEQAGTYALASIFTSALTTGFTSGMIAFDFDIDVGHRKAQPDLYG